MRTVLDSVHDNNIAKDKNSSGYLLSAYNEPETVLSPLLIQSCNNNNFIGKHKVFTVSAATYSGFKLLQ